MNPSLTEIAFVLDRSGSMSSVAESQVSGVNEFLRDQQAASGEASFTSALFVDEYLLAAHARPAGSVHPLSEIGAAEDQIERGKK